MSLLSLKSVSFTFANPPLLEEIDLEIGPGEKIGLLGRNGAGKSTLMKLLAGELMPDSGELRRAEGIRIARLLQEVPRETTGRIAEVVALGASSGGGPEPAEWEVSQRVDKILNRMSLDGDLPFESLSSGMKRRVLLAQALVIQPEILLLDEPTNHLDIESIRWLESFLKGYEGTLVFVTHDRVFLQALATRILEVDRGKLFDWECDYATFLKRREQMLAAEEKQNDLFDKKLAEEERWIRQGIKARRTRNEGRVRALQELRRQRADRREKQGNVRLLAQESERSGQLVLEATDLTFAYGDQTIIRPFSTLITRGDKIGIVGPNGAGKTTLLKLLLGELQPTSGHLRLGTKLNILYFDQLREQINEEQTVIENVGEGQTTLTINGKQKHIYGYLQDFLFTPERARRPARYLSGGERNRMLLARLFKRESNLLVLDEPTNDLDAETLELLEEMLIEYAGTLFLVSHDRAFLDNVTTSIFAFEGEGVVKEYQGGYADYVRQTTQKEQAQQQEREQARERKRESVPAGSVPSSPEKASPQARRLTYSEQLELEKLPRQIEDLESQQAEFHQRVSDPAFYEISLTEREAVFTQLQQIEAQLAELYIRWEDLETRQQA